MQHETPAKPEPSKSLPHHVHPLVAWTAIFNFALIFALAPAVSLAQTPTAAMSEGSEAMAMRLPESSKLAYARHIAMEQEGVKSAGTKKESEKPKKAERTAAQACVRSCRITKFDCTRSADSNAPALHVCFQKAANCLQTCGVSTVAATDKFLMATTLKEANEAYTAATTAARQKRADALKKAQSDFEADMKGAKDALAAAKAAIKEAAKTTSGSASN